WDGIFQRHWLSTAKKCKFPESEISQIMDRVVGDMDRIIDEVGNKLPKNFPDKVATPIFDGMKSARDRMG
ncbi:MAG: type II toxin-antitoxin system HipA family toxin, partial [Desulfuromonadales bacterium]|nr:type II toxin-antitoxin system HipA family toxin [Desulfuromonadales bacterium]